MCGLFGFSGHQPVDVTKIRWLAVENENRGLHSTGVYLIKDNKTHDRVLFKETGAATAFINTIEFESLIPGSISVQGHTRAATVGAVSKENAHPFEFDFTKEKNGALVVGAHNGFVVPEIHGYKQHDHFGFDKPFEVDSQLIFATLAKDGDFKRLPEIEGAIACSFQFPDKYPSQLFLYRATGRDLHIGLANEGIYYSSEATPLKYIGCKAVRSIKDNCIMVLQNGEIIDEHVLEVTPKVKFFLNAKRDTWHTSLTDSELRNLKLEKLIEDKSSTATYTRISNFGNGKKPAAKQIPMFSSDTPSTNTGTGSTTKFTDQLGLIIKDAEAVVKKLTKVEEKNCNIIHNYGIDDTLSCIFVLRLVSSTKNQPLPGWMVYSQKYNRAAGITALNGVVPLRFPKDECDKPHELIIAHPIQPTDENTFKLIVTPSQGRVMEGTLTLPFPQSDDSSSEIDSMENGELSNKTRSWMGLSTPSVSSIRSKCSGLLLPPATKTLRNIQQPIQSLYTRLKGGETTGNVGCDDNGEEVGECVTSIRTGEHNARIKTKKIPLINNASIKNLLTVETNSFKYKDDIKKIMNGREYNQVLGWWTTKLGKLLNVRMLLYSAMVIKLYTQQTFGNSHPIGYYARVLALSDDFVDNYAIAQLSDEDLRTIQTILKLSHTPELIQNGSEVAIEKK